ncbi:hypothetical protein [Streptomyces sp. NBC_00687]|uniref:hypothetical protein n=1 Tax=Streptomyces sp. NBC_00687 TaxID=2975807 RepID=UPI0022599025|nr:hypothetical protein [Streptomyces sp. NBC_00687]MCX4920302.1 hypothetical protein [Streptomyces sp. NBC_00687]
MPDVPPGAAETDGSDLPGDLAIEVRAWVLRFRLLLKRTGLSANAYARRHDLSAATLSNYSKGRTMPKESTVRVLLGDQPPGLTDEVVDQSWQLWEDALRVASSHEYAKHQLRGQARQAFARADALQVLVDALSNDVVSKDSRIDALDQEVNDLKMTLARDAVDNELLLGELNERIAALTAERDELRRSEQQTREHLADAERTRDVALRHADALASRLINIEEQTAPELDGGGADVSSEAREMVIFLERRLEELEQQLEQQLQESQQSSPLTDKIGNLEWAANSASMRLETQTARTQEQRDKKEKARKELSRTSTELAQQRAEHQQLRQAYDDVNAQHLNLKERHAQLVEEFRTVKQQNIDLQRQPLRPSADTARATAQPRRVADARATPRTRFWLVGLLTVANLAASYIVGNGFGVLQRAEHDTHWQLALYAALAVGLTIQCWASLEGELPEPIPSSHFGGWMIYTALITMLISIWLPDLPLLHAAAVHLQSPLNPD